MNKINILKGNDINIELNLQYIDNKYVFANQLKELNAYLIFYGQYSKIVPIIITGDSVTFKLTYNELKNCGDYYLKVTGVDNNDTRFATDKYYLCTVVKESGTISNINITDTIEVNSIIKTIHIPNAVEYISAYDLAVKNGYIGSFNDWFTTLKFRYSDFTDAEILELQKPALDAQRIVLNTDNEVKANEVIRIDNENDRIANEVNRTNTFNSTHNKLNVDVLIAEDLLNTLNSQSKTISDNEDIRITNEGNRSANELIRLNNEEQRDKNELLRTQQFNKSINDVITTINNANDTVNGFIGSVDDVISEAGNVLQSTTLKGNEAEIKGNTAKINGDYAKLQGDTVDAKIEAKMNEFINLFFEEI